MNIDQIIAQLRDLVFPFGLQLLGAIAVLIVGRIVAGLASRTVRLAMTRAKVDETIRKFVARLVSISVIAFAVVAALAKFGIQTTSFVALLGAAGLAVGLALQGSLSNFASGFLIIVFRPFGVGDFIEAGGVSGSVKEIRLFSTEMASPDNIRIVVPNSKIYGGVIKNFSGYETRRVDLTVGIGYSTSIDRAMEVVREVISSDSRIFSEPEAQVVVNELADSSVNLLIRCWTRRTEFWAVKCDLTKSLKEHFDIQGIEIPFPQRVIHSARS